MALNIDLKRREVAGYESLEARRSLEARGRALELSRRRADFEHMARHMHTCRECGRAYGPCLCSLPDFDSLCLACDSGEQWLLGLLEEIEADEEGGRDG